MNFTTVETTIMNRIQKDFPLVSDPLSALADELSIPLEHFLSSVKDLKKRGIVRNIAGIFNADRLGFVTTLVAFHLVDRDLPKAAEVINRHPGVSHNYQRDHHYNLWFTLAAESEAALDQTVRILAGQSGARDHIILRNEKLLKIGLLLSIGDEIQQSQGTAGTEGKGASTARTSFSDDEKETIRLLQKDLPLVRDPFATLIEADNSPICLEAFIACFQRLKQEGVVRRYAAVLRHREAGYRSNAMTVWKPVEGSDIEGIVKIFLESHLISHLYLRTLHPGKWEYPLFAMIHARSDDQLNAMIDELSRKSGIEDYQVLRSLKEFKKERVVYFSPRFEEWERQAGL